MSVLVSLVMIDGGTATYKREKSHVTKVIVQKLSVSFFPTIHVAREIYDKT